MADAPAKDVFADDDTGLDDDQRVVDEAEEAEEQAGTETAAADAGTDDIEIVLAEAEKDGEKEPDPDEAEPEGESLAVAEGVEPAEEADDDLKTYSKKVQDRIARERRLVKRAREEAEVAVGGERARRIEAERGRLMAHKNLTAVLIVNIDGQIKAKTAEFLAAKEQGESAKEVEAQGELDDLRAKKREIEGAKVSLEREAEDFERQAQAAPAKPQVSEATQTWLGQNKWFNKKGFYAETVAVRDLDNKLAGERSDKGSPDYFRELNRRIRQEMPELTDKVKRSFKPVVKAVQSAVAPVARSANSSRSDAPSKRRVTLDKQDLQNMREFKLDPTNKEHVAAYAREKLASQ